MESRSAILELLHALLAQKGDRDPVPNDSPLFTTGRLQSIDGIQVAVFLEERFGVDFSTIGFDQEKIDTVNSICALIEESRPREHAHP
jgi:acyl carrier protein